MRERSIAVSIVLSIVTCGIYGIYWFVVLTDDARMESGDNNTPSGGMAFLLTLVTCGIYGFYWAYKTGKTIAAAESKNGIPAEDNSVLYLILQLVGLGIINYALMQNSLNAIARKKAGVQA